jgi:hypothetical protein
VALATITSRELVVLGGPMKMEYITLTLPVDDETVTSALNTLNFAMAFDHAGGSSVSTTSLLNEITIHNPAGGAVTILAFGS